MAEDLKEETGFVDYYYSTGLKDPVAPPPPSDPTAGIKSTVLKPFEVKGIDRPIIDVLTRPNTGRYAGKPVFEKFKVDLDKVYDFDAEQKKLASDSGTDEVGMFSDPEKLGKVLGTGGLFLGSTSQNLGATGIVAALMAGKKGVPNPVTGDDTVSFIPFLDNLAMKEKYDAMSAIQQYIKTGDGTLGYDMFRLGGQTFIRKPGEFRFVGNVGALGIDHADLHKIMAVANEEDPRDYDYKTGKSNRNNILTYGNGLAGGYTLDGMHVDNKGVLASASIGASDEFAQMAYKYFNGKVIGVDAATKIAQQWLTSTAKLRKGGIFGGKYTDAEKEQLKANFQLFQQAAGIKTDLGAYGQAGPYDGGGFKPKTFTTNLTTTAGPDYTDIPDYQRYTGGDPMIDQPPSPSRDFTDVPTYERFKPNYTDIPNYQRFKPDYTDIPNYQRFEPPTVPKGFGGGDRFDMPPLNDAFDNDINDDTPVTNIVGGVDSTIYEKIKSKLSSAGSTFSNFVKDKAVIAAAPMALVIDEAQKTGTGGGLVGKVLDNVFGSKDDEPERKDVTTVSADFRPKATITSTQRDQIEKANKAAGFSTNLRFGFQEGGSVPSEQQAQLVGGVMPQEVSELETVADDQPRQVQEDSFVLNAPSVEKVVLNPEAINVAGVQDVRNMILDAYTFAKQQGMSIGNVDRRLYEESVDVALSKGELVIPPDLVKVIGQDRLEKINNRGKKEVKRRAEDLDEKRPQGLREGDSVQKAGLLDEILKNILPSHFGSMEGQSEQPVTRIDKNFNFLNADDEKPKSFGPTKIEVVDDKKEGFIGSTPTLAEQQTIPYEDLLESLEDNVGAGYVPKQPNGQPFPKSGVTIGLGVDLGQHNEASFRKYGVPTNLIKMFKPFFGKRGMDAQRALDKNNLVIDDLDDLRDLNNLIITGKMKEFEKKYPEFKNINDRDKGFMFAAHYHGSLKNYKTFMTEYKKTQSIPTALETGLFPKISKDGVDRNRADKALKWWESQSKTPETPLSKPLM